MREERYKGFILQFADSEHHTRDVARRAGKRMKIQPGSNWYIKQPRTNKVLDSRLTRDSARRAVNQLLEEGVMPEGELV